MKKVSLTYIDTKERPEETAKPLILLFEMLQQDTTL